MTMNAVGQSVGFVAIGRNEGVRLQRCLTSLRRLSDKIVYVDSGSSDDSVAFANSLGVNVVSLDHSRPFTAARARNAGFKALTAQFPGIPFVMFIDGDCEIADDFAAAAVAQLDAHAAVSIVTGRCRELYPNATIYNRLCDMEWDGPVGDIAACGGIFMIRTAVFEAIGGFNEAVIAAEDDELCVRTRAGGGRVVRIDETMCYHDADIRRFSQWWRRATRAGYAYAQVGELHAGYFAAPRRRAWLWGLATPAAAIGLAPVSKGGSLVLLLLYPLSFIRNRSRLIRDGVEPAHASLNALFLALAKFANLAGMLEYRWKKRRGEDIGIVEYK